MQLARRAAQQHAAPLRRGAARCTRSLAAAAGGSLEALLARTAWLLPDARAAVTPLRVGEGGAQLLCVRDDLLHPLVAGNKARKLDGLVPALLASGCTHVVSCGGAHSAHAAAVAAVSSSAGLQAHLLLRGENPAVLTGHALTASLFAASVRFVSRDAYADRGALLAAAADELRALGARRVGVIPEGAACAGGALGVLRGLHAYTYVLDGARPCTLVVDAGTGATAWALALGAALLRLPWRVLGVCVASHAADCARRAEALAAEWDAAHPELRVPQAALPLQWAPPPGPRRRFGAAPAPGDVAACRALAAASGVLTDPVWTLHAYRAAAALAREPQPDGGSIAWVHTGGAVGALDGAAQRWPALFTAELGGSA